MARLLIRRSRLLTIQNLVNKRNGHAGKPPNTPKPDLVRSQAQGRMTKFNSRPQKALGFKTPNQVCLCIPPSRGTRELNPRQRGSQFRNRRYRFRTINVILWQAVFASTLHHQYFIPMVGLHRWVFVRGTGHGGFYYAHLGYDLHLLVFPDLLKY